MRADYIKLIVIQFVTIIGIAICTHLLSEFRLVKLIIFLILIACLSYYEFQLFRKDKKNRIITFLVSLTSIWLLFEGTKQIEYFYGLLPRFGDVPRPLSAFLSLLGISVYLGGILLVEYGLSKFRKGSKKED